MPTILDASVFTAVIVCSITKISGQIPVNEYKTVHKIIITEIIKKKKLSSYQIIFNIIQLNKIIKYKLLEILLQK